ncbi:hypothetical protein [Streptomyces sp. NEAU-YJ-81]|uniref:hypothetical protein n=1 Tax=Streptomyces sp. NEAU-YJ-81 TaxID=2820288 RepID=UPI0027DF5829|nr:hypothetical protein [Streptomyces sp. NEAU-YJ-81]
MSVGWRWEYDPDHAHVAGGIPAHVVTEVERLAGHLVDLAGMGVDVSDYGNGPRAGGCAAWTRQAAISSSWWHDETS